MATDFNFALNCALIAIYSTSCLIEFIGKCFFMIVINNLIPIPVVAVLL